MMGNKVKQAVLFASDARGIYIPQHFAESFDSDMWQGFSESDIQDLLKGPESESYWESWESLLNDIETIDDGVLYQDGDLWVIWPQDAIDAINTYCSDCLEYEESHMDAGDNYAHMPAESWCKQKTLDLMAQMKGPEVQDSTKDYFAHDRWIPSWYVDTMGLDPDRVADLALDLFTMESGSIFGPYKGGIVLDSYPIQEFEIELDHLGIDQLTMEHVRESCEAYIAGTDRAYLNSDSVWYAVVDPVALQEVIKQEVKNDAS